MLIYQGVRSARYYGTYQIILEGTIGVKSKTSYLHFALGYAKVIPIIKALSVNP